MSQTDQQGFPDGMAAAGEDRDAGSPGDEQRRRRGCAPLLGVLVILFIIGVVVGPLFYFEFSKELARWQLAAAFERRLDGDLAAAIAMLDEAIQQYPDHAELYLYRASWKLEAGDAQAALQDCERAKDLTPQDARVFLQRSEINLALQRGPEAVADVEQYIKLLAPRGRSQAAALNQLAYTRAVANQDLEVALSEVTEALKVLGDDAALLDTRGFINYLRGDLQAARADMEKAVKMIESEYAAMEKRVNEDRLGVADIRSDQMRLARVRKSVAVLLYHRGLVYEQLDEAEKAAADFDRVRELQFEPGPQLY